MKRLTLVGLSVVFTVTVATEAFAWGSVHGAYGGAAYRGPMGGAAVRGPAGGYAARGPYGGAVAGGPGGAAAYRPPSGAYYRGGAITVLLHIIQGPQPQPAPRWAWPSARRPHRPIVRRPITRRHRLRSLRPPAAIIPTRPVIDAVAPFSVCVRQSAWNCPG